jgi:hypothetical protein
VFPTHIDPSSMSTVLCLWCLTSGASVMKCDARNDELCVYMMVSVMAFSIWPPFKFWFAAHQTRPLILVYVICH